MRNPSISRATLIATLNVVCALHRVSAAEILGDSRYREVAWARQHAMWLLRQRGHGFSEIGRKIGKLHWTVMHGVAAHETHGDYIHNLMHSFIQDGEPEFPQNMETVHRAIAANERKVRAVKAPPRRRTVPTRAEVETAASAAALDAGFPVEDVLGHSRSPYLCKARKQAWRVLLAAGHSTNGISKVWGCSRKSVQRVQHDEWRKAGLQIMQEAA